MSTVFKYPLAFSAAHDAVCIEMPVTAQILTLQCQYDRPCIWAKVDPDSEMRKRVFVMYGTGQDIRDEKPHTYIGTFQVQGGTFVFHVFEVPA